ncbi:MAG TPA: hypothetical protein VKA94_05665 [Hyphomicrobiales bacterium]|nr:hypothetical protein [Hyphomicrobiales bacterium]
MTLNLLQIATRALDEISSFNSPNNIIGNSDDTAKTLLAAAYKTGEELVREFDWQELSKTATVNTVASTSLYDLESDYERIAPDTMWNNSEARYMRGHTTRRKWAAITNASVYSSFTYDWRLKGGQIQVFPTPSSVFTFNYEYLSNIYCTASDGTTDRADGWVNDTDLPKLPQDLFIYGIRYYFADSKTLANATKWGAEYYDLIETRQNTDVPGERVNMAASVRAPRGQLRRLNIPDIITGY